MSAPPVLRPLRAILQRRLRIVPSRPIQTPYYLRASPYRSQLRHNSSIPPEKPPKPEEFAQQEASSEQTPEAESTSTATLSGETQSVTSKSPAGSSSAPVAEVEVEANVVTNFDIGGRDAIVEAAVPRLDSLLVKSAFQQLKSTDAEIQAEIAEVVARQLAAAEETTEPVVSEAVVDAAGPETAEPQIEVVEEAIASDEALSQEPVQPAAVPKTEAPGNSAPQQAGMPGLEALKHASPDQIAAMMAYLQTLQASTTSVATAETAVPQNTVEQQNKATTSASSSAEAIASMTESVEPAQLGSENPQSDVDQISIEDAVSDLESGFVVDPIPHTASSEEDAVVAPAEASEHLDKNPEENDDAKLDIPTVQESVNSAAVEAAPEQTDMLDSAVAADEASSVDHSLDDVRDDELAKLDRAGYAKELAENEDAKREALGEAGEELLNEAPELSRIPRNVAAYYLQPLRRVAEYGVPACDLQLRSYSIRPLESFCDFALRAAYYLGLPAYGPVPLPKIIERWTVPKSSFIFKKSQENFERITRRRLIQIKDAQPETVQIWLAFLQKHQQAAVGMKANMWEFSSIDVAKQMDEASKQAEPFINDKYRLLQQNKEFQTVEKVDEFLQAERYRLTGDRVLRNQ